MVNIIIATYNATPWIEKCLSSCDDYPVVVVDNCSTDETISTIQNQFPKVTVLPQDENLGFGQANNIGISYALNHGAEYIFLLNQDAYLQQGCVEALLSIHRANPEIGVLSPMHMDGSGDRLDVLFSQYLHRYGLTNPIMADWVNNTLKPYYTIPFVNAAAWLVPATVLRSVGGFDPLFFHYGEDENYCQRLEYHNLKVALAPMEKVFHDRANRARKQIVPYSTAYYEEYVKLLRIKWADITNDEFDHSFLSNKTYLLKKILNYLITFNWNKAMEAMEKRALIGKQFEPIKKSRNTNTKPNGPYLDLDH